MANIIERHGEDPVAVKSELNNLKTEKGILNIRLYRRYLRHWLCDNYKVSRTPRMIISIKAPQAEGIPLEVYTYIKEPSLELSNHIASEITEHILQSMQWFGLRLFQRPTSHDISSYFTLEENEES